jgi:hypothetical protein
MDHAMIIRTLCVICLLIASPQVISKCPFLPTAVYEVDVFRCQETTFRSSPLTYKVGDERKPYDLENSEYTGVIAVVEIVSGRLVSIYPDIEIERELATLGSINTVFIDGSASQICSGDRSKRLTISTMELCCDTIPNKDKCLVPFPIMEENTDAVKTESKAKTIALQAAKCKSTEDCHIFGWLRNGLWNFTVFHIESRTADGTPKFIPFGWVRVVINQEGEIVEETHGKR